MMAAEDDTASGSQAAGTEDKNKLTEQQQQQQQQQQIPAQEQSGAEPAPAPTGTTDLLLESEEDARRQEEARAAALATRPFAEQMANVCGNLQLKSQAAEAARYLLNRLMIARAAEVAVYPSIIELLSKVIADGPGMPAAGAAMMVLAQLCLVPESRARVRAEASLLPVVRYLALAAEPEKSANAEAAALLLMNVASDRLARRGLVTAGALEMLVALLQVRVYLVFVRTQAAPLVMRSFCSSNRWLQASYLALPCHAMITKQKVTAHTGAMAGYLAGALTVMVVTDETGRVQQRFVDGGGIEAACKALAERPRNDTERGTLRLRMLLAELCRVNKSWEVRTHQAAAGFSSQIVGGATAPLSARGGP